MGDRWWNSTDTAWKNWERGVFILGAGGINVTVNNIIGAHVTVDNGNIAVTSLPAVTGHVTSIVTSIPSVTGNITVTSPVSVNATIVNTLPILVTGGITAIVTSTPSITGHVTVSSIPSITGNVTVTSPITVNATLNNAVATHDATSAADGVQVVGEAVEMDGTPPGEVIETDATRIKATLDGRMLVASEHPNHWTFTTSSNLTLNNCILQTAPGANLSLYVTDIIISNGTTTGDVSINESAAAEAVKVGPMYFATDGGCVMNLRTPIRLAANTNLTFTSESLTNHSVTAMGYTAP